MEISLMYEEVRLHKVRLTISHFMRTATSRMVLLGNNAAILVQISINGKNVHLQNIFLEIIRYIVSVKTSNLLII